MFTLDQIKLVILENEKLQNEVTSLKEQMAKQQSESVVSTWKQRALIAEAQLEFINRKANVEIIPQEDKWEKITELMNSDMDNLLNAAINLHIELFNLGLKVAKKEVIERYFVLDSEGNYVKSK